MERRLPRAREVVMARAEKKAKKPSGGAKHTGAASSGFTAEEKAAMQERVREMKAEGQRGKGAGKADGEAEVLAKLAAMPPADRAIGERLHAIIRASAPGLTPKTWYGMPAYARDDKIICFFQNAGKFKARYSTLGFSDKAKLDDGAMWPTGFALKSLGSAEEARIVALLKKAVG